MTEQFGYAPTWLPLLSVSPGTFGHLRKDGFEVLGTIKDLVLPESLSPNAAVADIQHISKDGASVTVDATLLAGIHDMNAACTVSFAAEQAVLFAARECRS